MCDIIIEASMFNVVSSNFKQVHINYKGIPFNYPITIPDIEFVVGEQSNCEECLLTGSLSYLFRNTIIVQPTFSI